MTNLASVSVAKNSISLNTLWLKFPSLFSVAKKCNFPPFSVAKNSKSLHWGCLGVGLVSVRCRFGVGLGFCVKEVSGQRWEALKMFALAVPNAVQALPDFPLPFLANTCRTHARLHFHPCCLVFGLDVLVRGVVGVCFSPFFTPLFFMSDRTSPL